MDSENPTGNFAEFLELAEPSAPAPDAAPDSPPDEPTAAADPESAAEDDELDLTPEERVAAALAADAEEYEEDAPPEQMADADDEDEEVAPGDLDALTPEQLRELAEEALRLRAEAPQQEVARIQAEAQEAVATAVATTQQQIEAAFQQQVIAVSEAHYGNLIAQELDGELAKIIADANRQTQVDAEVYIAHYGKQAAQRITKRITAAQRTWEDEQRAKWQPQAEQLLHQAAVQAQKQHPGVRQLYAKWLAEQKNLPAKAVDEILKEADTDRMAERADWLAQLRDVKADERRRGNQQVREEKAKAVSERKIASPATGRPKPGKVVPFTGEYAEFAALKNA